MSRPCYAFMDSPVGRLTLVCRGGALARIGFEADPWDPAGCVEDTAAAAPVGQQLREYFGGTRRDFDLTLVLEGTSFQKKVWSAVAAIPFGTTVSYGELAQRIGSPEAARAVGAACGANPIPLVIPCHRAVGSNGRLTGYRGGVEAKRWLLGHESALALEAGRRPA